MQRWLILLLSVVFFWGAAAACSGGGGGGGSPSTPTNTTQVGTNDITLPDGSIKHPDGSITYPDGSVMDANGIVKRPDGSVKFPDGTSKLPDGTFKLPNGTVAKEDGTIISAPKVPEITVPGGTEIGGGTVQVTAIIPTASIGGVVDGQLLGTAKPTMVTTDGSKDAVSFLWTLDGPGVLDDHKTSTDTSFELKLPDVSGNDPVSYTLSLQAKSKTGDIATRKITLNAMPKPVLVIENGAGLADGGAWPVNTVAAFTPVGSQFNPALTWGVTHNGTAVDYTKGKLTLDSGSVEQVIFKPAAVGQYVVTLEGVNDSGKSTKTFTMTVKDIPTSKISGVENENKYSNDVELSAAGSTAGVSYAWKLYKRNDQTVLNSSEAVTWKPQPGPGQYTATLQVTDDSIKKDGNLASVNFDIIPAPKAVISGVENGKAYAVDGTITLSSATSENSDGADVAWSIQFVKPDGTQESTGSSSATHNVNFNAAATYKATLTVTTIGGSDSATVEFSAINKAIGKISGITPGYSYRKTELPVTASGSSDATDYKWSLMFGNVQESGATRSDVVMTPQQYGAYTLKLLASNAIGNADPVEVAFNVRPSQPMQMMPFDLSQNATIFALSDKDIYVGGPSGLLHFGADAQPVQVVAAPVYAIWARSSNEVFAGTSGGLYRYTVDGGGWKLVASDKIPAGGLASLTGANNGILYAVTADGKAIKSTDNGDTWSEQAPNTVFKFIDATANDTLFAVTANGSVLDNAGGNWNVLGANEKPSALYVRAADDAYVAAENGKVYYYSKTEKDFSLSFTLPKVIINQVLVQEYAMTLWKEMGADFLHAITQNGHHYLISIETGAMPVVSTGDLSVIAAHGGTTRLAVDTAGAPYKLVNGKWETLVPSGDDALTMTAFQKTVGGVDYRPGARVAGDSLFLFNMISTKETKASLLQRIGANGGRTLIPLDWMVLDVWGSSGNDVYILAQRNVDRKIFYYNGTTVAEFMPATIPNSTELISAIGGEGSALKYVATNRQIYEVSSGKSLKVVWENAETDIGFRTLWVAPDRTVYAGTNNGMVVMIAPDGTSAVANIGGDSQDAIHQILGASNTQIYATTDSKVFQMGPGGWSEILLPNNASGFQPHHIAIVSPTEVYFAGDNGLLHVTSNWTQLISGGKFYFFAQAGQFSYYGTPTQAGSTEVSLQKLGPMQ
jgi:photosystem II stability/assembly factor-like uncharacterized protein